MTALSLQRLLRQKNVVFITVKNKEYIRVTQIERLLKQEALSYIVYSSEKSNPLTRALDLNRRIKKIDLSGADVVILGFLPQLVWKSVSRKLGRNAKVSRDNQRKTDQDSLYNINEGKVTLVADFFLSLYDTIALDRKLVSPRGIVSNMLRKLDREALKGADLVITDTKADADFFSAEFNVNRDKFEVLYLEADKKVYSSNDKTLDQNLDATGASEKKEVLYFGTGLPLQGTDIVLEAFDEVAGDEQIKCTYIGGTKGVAKELLGRLSANPRVEVVKWLPQEELSKRIEGASLCLAGHFNAEIDKADRTIPGKAYIYEAMNKTMILGDTKANHELFSEDERHIFVKRGDSRALADAIRGKISV